MAAATYQTEGAWNEDGKGEAIWDRYPHGVRYIKGGDRGDVACDHYHLYKQDIALLRRLSHKSYRFSISWARIQPRGTGAPNQKGLDHYKRVMDAVLGAGIRPFCTLCHWDLPQVLEDKGGWPNRDLAGYFADCAGILARNWVIASLWGLRSICHGHLRITDMASALIHPTGRSSPIS